jgi:hypothetical protein
MVPGRLALPATHGELRCPSGLAGRAVRSLALQLPRLLATVATNGGTVRHHPADGQ